MKDTRSANVKSNIIYSFILKGIGLGLAYLLLPLTVHYLTTVEYGVWVTLFSVMNWVMLLDLGIGLGIRNKLTIAIGKDDIDEIKIYISTGIASMILIGLGMLAVFFVAMQFIDFQFLFNTVEISEIEFRQIISLTGVFIIITFVLSLINQFYYAYQKAAITGAIQLVHNLIMLLIIYFLTLKETHHILYFILGFGVASIVSKSIFIIYFFYDHKDIKIKLNYIKWSKIKGISTLGIKFFIIQLTSIIIFSMSNILISQCLGIEYVRSYDVLFKIFGVITMVYALVSAPLWAAYTDAYTRKDFVWIKKSLRKMQLFMLPIISLVVILILKIDWIIKFWIGADIDIPSYLPEAMGFFVIITCWSNNWAIFLNGIGKIELQMYSTVCGGLFILFSSFYFMKQMGSTGMVISMDLGLLFSSIVLFFQVRYIMGKYSDVQ